MRRRPWTVAGLALGCCAVLTWRIGLRPELAAFLYLGVLGAALSVVDVALHRLPDPLTLPSYGIAAALLGAAAWRIDGGGALLAHALLGMAALWLIFAVQWFLLPGAIGMGDVKLAGVLGLYLGWLGAPAWFFGMPAMFVLGGGYAAVLLATRRASRKSGIPFGPFMLLGTLAAVLVHAPRP